MIPFRRYSIRQKLMAMSLWASSGALVLAAASFMVCEFLVYRGAMVKSVSTLAEIINSNVASAVVFNDDVSAAKTLASLKARSSIFGAGIYTPEGRLFAQWNRNSGTLTPAPPFRAMGKETHRFEHESLTLFRPMILDRSVIGMVYIQSDLSDLTIRLRRFAEITTGVLVISFFVAALISFKVGERISRPILDLTRVAQAVSEQKDYSVRAVKSDPDELGLLVRSFNQMVIQIQGDGEALRRLNEDLEQKVTERTRELSAANKELEAFSYSVSHDLRAPLRTIDGFSRELLENHSNQLNEQGQADLKRVRAASQRMGQLIDDLLKLSRITRNDLTRNPVDLSALVKDIAEKMKAAVPDRVVEFVIAPGVTALGDVALLRVALENLLDNALKFTGKCSAARIEFGVEDQAAKRIFFVRDNGAGFDMAHSGKLFGVFERLHDLRDYPGTGIGLATVQRIVQRHGGEIWAKAVVKGGATFFFTLS